MSNEAGEEGPPATTRTEEAGDDGVLDAAAHPHTPGAAYNARGERDDEDSAPADTGSESGETPAS